MTLEAPLLSIVRDGNESSKPDDQHIYGEKPSNSFVKLQSFIVFENRIQS